MPDWGKHCTAVTGLPSVTIQYLSDVAAIRLSRDCGDEEGEKHVLCRAGEVSARTGGGCKTSDCISQFLFQDRATVLSQLTCNNVGAGAAASSSSVATEGGEFYATSDESLYTTEDEVTATVAAASSVALSSSSVSPPTTRSSMDSAINKIVTEIQSIATNDSLNGELEPLKPRKTKKYNSMGEKKYKKVSLAKVTEKPLKPVTLRTSPSTIADKEILPRVKKMRPEDLKHNADTLVDELAMTREDRVRRETLNLPMSTGAAAVEETEETVQDNSTTPSSVDDDLFLISNGTDDTLVSVTTLEENLDSWNNGTEVEVESSSPAPVEEDAPTVVTTTTQQLPLEISGTPHSAQPKGSITHPMHISSDMTKELNEVLPQKKIKVVNQQDHFVPPLLLAKFTPGKQHVDTHENLLESNFTSPPTDNTIESPAMETTNDISKFYPASTPKAIASDHSDQEHKIIVEGLPEVNVTEETPSTVKVEVSSSTVDSSASTTTTLLPEASSTPAVTTTTTVEPVTSETPTTAPAKADEEPQKYHSEFSFTNVENYHPYRPNRRRSLTKHSSHSFLRKILG